MKNKTLVIASMIVIVVSLAFTYITWYKDSSLKTVNIGVISTTDEDFEKYAFLASQAEKDLNSISRNQNRNIIFNFTVFSGGGDVLTPFDIIYHNWEDQSMNLYVAGGLTSQLTVMRSFLEDNKILVVSPSSTTPQLSQKDFQRNFIIRLSPDYLQYPPLMARFSIEYGLNKILVIGIEYYIDIEGNIFAEEFEKLGGEVLGSFSYRRVGNYSIEDQNYAVCLLEANGVLKQVSSTESVGIFFIGGFELEDIITESNNYPFFSNITWLNLDAYNFPEDVLLGIGETLNNASLITSQPVIVYNEKTNEINNEYKSLLGDDLDFYSANVYDSCMILGLSVIEADSDNSTLVRDVLPTVAEDFIGLTGQCGLNSFGDRSVFRTGFYKLSTGRIDLWKSMDYHESLSDLKGQR